MKHFLIWLLEPAHRFLTRWMLRSGMILACADAPDVSGMNRAAEASAALSRDALAWYQQAYADQAPAREAAAAKANAVADAQIGAMNFATDQAKELDAYNKATFRPVEQQLATTAQNYDTPERRMQAAQAAAADVDQSFAGTQQATQRSLGRAGVSLDSGKSLALMQGAALAQAKARAGAETTAVRNVEQQGWSRMADVANLGKGIASAQATQQGIATSAGTAGVNASTAGLSNTQSGNGLMTAGFNTALAGQQQAGSIYGQAASIEQKSQEGLMSGLTGLGALGVKLYQSDKAVKKKTGRMVDQAKALKQIEATPVEDGWEYDPAKGGPDDGGTPHTGPMAQNVHKTMGDQVAPGGKAIDIVSMNGKMMAAIQQLSKEVKALKRMEATEKEAA